MIGLLSFLGVWTSGEAAPPAVVAELETIEKSFASDNTPLTLLPHEWAQLRRIRAVWQRDRARAITALKIMAKRATAARRALRSGKAA